LLRRSDGSYDVIETEGGHVDFAPIDALEDRILANLRKNFRRVSVERLISGRGLMNIYEALGAIEGHPLAIRDDQSLWAAALAGTDSLATAALDRFCLCLGAVAGDLALAQGAGAVVVGGGIGLRLADHLPASGFATRFIAKGRFERRMADLPVKLITHPQPGLFGAAAAFAHASA
jgi:glucokinase